MQDLERQKHYEQKVELWDLTLTANIHPNLYSAIKYVVRYKRKGTPLEDLQKAIDFIEKLGKIGDFEVIWGLYTDESLLDDFINQFVGIERDIIRKLTTCCIESHDELDGIVVLLTKLRDNTIEKNKKK